jgi:hypothetical protein
MNVKRVSELLCDIIENAGEETLKLYAEFTIKDCNNPECETCKELKEALDESIG